MDPNLFFADSQGSQPHAAQKVCRRCPVQQQCAEFAVRHHIRHGVWGGLTEKKRRTLTPGIR